MGKSRMMGAGLGSSSLYNTNTNVNTSGGSKKQGLAYKTGVQQINNRNIKSYAQGNNRNIVFYMNQVGGVSPSLRNIQVGGVHHIPFHQATLSDILSASKATLNLWTSELSSTQRVRKFILKKYTGSFEHGTFRAFIIKYLPRLKVLIGSGGRNSLGATENTEDTMDPSMSLTYGGVTWNGYSQSGGSRLYLSNTNTLLTSQNPNLVTRTTNYVNIDCTKNVTISADVNISTIKAGSIFTFYLVPMLKASNDTTGYRYNGLNSSNCPVNTNLSAGLASLGGVNDAEWGLGYRDAQSVSTTTNGFTTADACIELDLFEMSLCNVQTTIHAYVEEFDKSNPFSYTPAVPANRIIDRKGTYENAWKNKGGYLETGHYSQSDANFDKTSTNPPFGPGASFQINTLETFNISSSIVVSNYTGNTGTTLTLTTTITQGSNTITLQPTSPPWMYFSQTGSGLDSTLAEMQLVSALWVPTSSSGQTTWLDGIDYINPIDPDYEDSALNNYLYIKSFAQNQIVQNVDAVNQPGVTYGGGDTGANMLTGVNFDSLSSPSDISYSYADNMGSSNYTGGNEPSQTNGPIFARYNNVNIKTEETISYNNICWSFDFYFRGITNNNNSLNNWHGFYGNSCCIAYDDNSSLKFMSDAFTTTLTDPALYFSNVSTPLNYLGGTPKYFATLTGLGQTDYAQTKGVSTNSYGYSLLDQDTSYNPIVPIPSGMVTALQTFNKYGIQYISTPNLITFSTF